MGVLLPLIVFGKEIVIPESIAYKLHMATYKRDLFTYYRGYAVLITALLMLFIMIYEGYSNEERRNKINLHLRRPENIFAGIFVAFILLSYFSSDYMGISLLGHYITGEGTLHWISYIVIYVYTSFYCSENTLKYIYKGLYITVSIIFLVGIISQLGYRLFEQEWFMKLITPSGTTDLKLKDPFALSFGTFFGNSNYLGGFVSIMLPFAIMFDHKWNVNLLSYWILAWMLFAALIFSKSSAGFLGVLAALILWLIYLQVYKKFSFKRHGVLYIGFITIFILINALVGSTSVTDEIDNLSLLMDSQSSASNLKDIEVKFGYIVFSYSDEEIVIDPDQNQINVLVDGTELELESNTIDGKTVLSPELPLKRELRIIPKQYNVFQLYMDDVEYFIVDTEEGVSLLNMYGDFIENTKPPRFGFESIEGFANSRGYIWARTLPILKDYIFVGHGADVFALHFPNDDTVGLLRSFGKYTIRFEKPHNNYLLIACNFGVLSLILFTAMIIQGAFLNALKLSKENMFRAVCLLIGILTSWLFNDSMIVYSSSFWVIFGLVSNLDKVKKA